MKTLLIAVIVILVLAAGWVGFVTYVCEDDWCFIFPWQKIEAADSFQRCAGFGFPVTESYPHQCRAGDKTFTETVEEPNSNLIHVTAPLSNAIVESPLTVSGEARGNWYFEASFPVRIYDANNKELGVTPAQAKGDWMTTEFVSFEAVLTFSAPATETGTLILQNDNPSGLPENSKEVRIPVRFLASSAIKSAEFDKPVTASLGGKVSFPDGLILGVKEINDSRCKSGMVCVWQGELSLALTALNGKFGGTSQEIRLGTVNNTSVSLKGYTFSLVSATAESATFIVSLTSAGISGISGYIHMGPTCPVERNPPDPKCADRQYVSAPITVTNLAGKQYQGETDAGGNFRITLPASAYSVTVAPQNTFPSCDEKKAVVVSNMFTNLDISCDTGIR